MTTPASGTLAASQIDTELGRSATATMSMDGAPERSLAGVASGPISFQNLRNKAVAMSVVITSNTFKSGSATTIISDPITVIVSGGSGTYSSYAWTKTNQLGPTITINAPTSATTTFSATFLAGQHDLDAEADVMVTVTDSLGLVQGSNVCHVDIYRI